MAEPLRPNAEAARAADDAFKRQIVTLNTYGERACGWQP